MVNTPVGATVGDETWATTELVVSTTSELVITRVFERETVGSTEVTG